MPISLSRPSRSPIGFLLLWLVPVWLLSSCGSQPTPVPTPVAIDPPTISDPKISAPTPQEPGQEIGISVDVSSASGAILSYDWRADGGEIVRGQGSPAITYRTPEEPGIYNVRVAVKWDNSSVEKITTIRVEESAVAVAVELPTDTPGSILEEEASKATPLLPPTTRQPTDIPQPTDTPIPEPTNTPLPTPTPTATIDADPTMYDNFNSPANEGSLNQSLWYDWSDGSSQVIQQNGILIITRSPKPDTSAGLDAVKYSNFALNKSLFFEAKLMMESSKAPESHVFILLGSNLPTQDYSDCTLGGDGYPEQAWVGCNYVHAGESIYSEGKSVAYNTWHTVQIAVDPATMMFNYYIDDQLIGSYAPENVEKLRDAKFTLNVGVYGETSETFVGYIDDVRIGQLGQ